MSDLPPPHDPIEALGEAYELLLETAMEDYQKAKQKSGPALHRLIDQARQKLVTAKKFTEQEGTELAAFLKRDLRDAAAYLEQTGGDLKQWLGDEAEQIEERLRERFAQAADQTTVELNQLREEAELAGYRTGEITGPGTLVCDQCGEQLHFGKPGRIPPCPKCKATAFHRKHT